MAAIPLISEQEYLSQHPFAHVLKKNPAHNTILPPRKPGEPLVVVDLFCGAGGTSSGVIRGLRGTGRRINLIAVNHWIPAIETMKANYGDIGTFFNASLESVHPRIAVPGGRVDLLVASPECLMFSSARGNKPIREQSRSSAAFIYTWLSELYVDAFCLENVPEWKTWGPLDEDLRPIKGREGEYFESFLGELRKLGYALDHKILNAADYGDATSRRRIFVLGRRDGQPVVFPQQSHAEDPGKFPAGMVKPWRAAREIIDWNDLGISIVNRVEGPHAVKTLQRMQAGFIKQDTILASAYAALIERYLPIAEKFMSELPPPRKNSKLTAKERRAIRQQAIANAHKRALRAFTRPLVSISSADLSNAPEAMLLGQHGGSTARINSEPLMTIAAKGAIGKIETTIEPCLVNMKGQSTATSPNLPAPTITAHAPHLYLAQPQLGSFIVKMNVGAKSTYKDEIQSLNGPVRSIVGKDCRGIVNSELKPMVDDVLFPVNHGGDPNRTSTLSEPVEAITAKRSLAKARPVITYYYGDPKGRSGKTTDEILDTITAGGNHFGVATPEDPKPRREARSKRVRPFILIDGQPFEIDILFRMLNNTELARATGFITEEDSYHFYGSSQVVTRQIGNAVPVHVAMALIKAQLRGYIKRGRKSDIQQTIIGEPAEVSAA